MRPLRLRGGFGSGRSVGVRRSGHKTAFTRGGQLTLVHLGVAGRDQVERLASTSAQIFFPDAARSFGPTAPLVSSATPLFPPFNDSTRRQRSGTSRSVPGGPRPTRAAADPTVVVRIKAADCVDLLTGQLGSITALLDGRAVVEGDFELASRMVDMSGGIPGK